MKPLELVIEGLRSYRDAVRIDFAWLSGAGLFGIVGPTGAGKSTILDAIFLALYGDVPRANTAAQLVHPDAAAAVVELTFQTLRGGQAETWRVRREWKRVKKRGQTELSGEVGPPRVELHRLTPSGPELVAGKASDVNTEITERVVGIPMVDFRTAIVLPQGEFDRLLRSGAKDRAQLLGRIFGLSRFGSPLYSAAKQRLLGLQGKHAEIEAKRGMRAVDPAELERLSVELASARTEAESLRTEKLAADEAARLAARGLELAKRLAAAEREAVAVELAAPALALARTELDAAERAGRAFPAFETLAAATARETELVAREAAKTGEARTAAEAAMAAEARATVSAAELEAQAPVLDREIRLAAQAVADLAEAVKHETEAEKAVSEAIGVEAALSTLSSRAQVREADRVTLRASLATQEEQLVAARVAPEERRRLAAALEAAAAEEAAGAEIVRATQAAARRLKSLEEARPAAAGAAAAWAEAQRKHEESRADPALAFDADALKTEGEDRRAALEEARRAAQELQLAEAASDEVGRREGEASEQLRDRVAARRLAETRREEAALAFADAGTVQVRADATYSAALQAAQAAHLAQFLAKGEACPVCGAHEHPAPATVNPDVAAARAESEAAGQLVALARSALDSAVDGFRSAGAVVETAERILEERRGERHRAILRIEAVRAGAAVLASVPWHEGPAARHEALAKLDAELVALRERFKTGRTKRLAAEARLESAVEAVRRAEQLALTSNGAVEAGAREHETALAVQAEAEAAFDAKRAGWLALRDGAPVAAVRAQRDAFAKRDGEAERLEGALSALRARLERSEGEAQIDERERAKLDERRTGLKTTIEHAGALAAGKRRSVVAVVAGEAPAVWLASKEAALRTLRAHAAAAAAARDTARRALAGLEAAVAEVASARLRATADRESASLSAEQALADSLFAALADIEHARRSAADRERLMATVRQGAAAEAAALAALATVRTEVETHALALPDEARATALGAVARDTATRLEAVLDVRTRAEERHRQLSLAAQEGTALAAELALLDGPVRRAETMVKVLAGEALVAFAADRHLAQILAAATGNLRLLSSDRYALVRGPDGAFAVRDRHQADAIRGAATLSGGECFLVSLALALALSDHIQQQGSVRFDFFFLDEGFGSLDEDTLGVAIDALERLRGLQRTIGTISHVPALHERLPRRLVVRKAGPGGSASVTLEG